MRRFWAPLASIALLALASPAAAGSGLVVKLKDGSTPVNAPDLFANALTQAWGDGSRFCAALTSLLSGDANGQVTSCVAQPYGSTGVLLAGRTPLVAFTGRVTLKGSSPYYQTSCPFTDTINLSVQAPLTITGDALAITAISFAQPRVTAVVAREVWGGSCTAAQHPGGIGSTAASFAQTAASDVNFPGSALNNALAQFTAPMKQALQGAVYTPSISTGDIVYAVVGGYVHQKPSEEVPLRLPRGH